VQAVIQSDPRQRTSLRKRLVEMRVEYTAEPTALAGVAVAGALSKLTAQDRVAIIDELLGDGTMLVDRARPALLPEAVSANQQWLESRVLAGLVPAAELADKMSNPIAWVNPHPKHLIVKMHTQAILSFLAAFMPRMVDGVLIGTPGMRVKPSRRSLVVYSIDSPEAYVLLASVPRHLWDQIASNIIDVTGDPNAISLWGPPIGADDLLSEPEPHPLTDVEAAARAEHSPESPIDAVGSALLRRSGLSTGVGVWHRDGAHFRLNTHNSTEIGDALCDRLFGIPYRVAGDSERVTVAAKWEGWE
jgi:hypothetical protein